MRYLFIYDVFIGSAIALRKNSHLQVDVFLNLMKERTKYIYTIVVTILGILFLAVLFVYSISLCKISAVNITPGLQVSMAIPYACMPLGAVLMILTSFEVIGKNVEKLKQCKKGADV